MVIRIKIFSWEKAINFETEETEFKIGDIVIVKTEFGVEAGEVVNFSKNIQKNSNEVLEESIIRKATQLDLETIEKYRTKGVEAFKFAREKIKELELKMKLAGAQFSFDGSKITFAFISDFRIDFRDLIKIFSKHFQKSIRFQQIGSRDEARQVSGYGFCGRELCCSRFLKTIGNVTIETAKIQQLDKRGSVMLSGVCGRLRCCLKFETEVYQELLKKMPAKGKIVYIKKNSKGIPNIGKKGKVINLFPLSQKVEIELEDKTKMKMLVSDLSFAQKGFK